MISIRVQSTGITRLRKTFGTFGRFPEILLRPATRASAEVIANKAKQTTAFRDRTGKLRASIRVEQGGRDQEFTARAVAGGGEVDYAPYVEYGTVRARPHPFMRPAAYSTRRQQGIAAREAVREVFRRNGLTVPSSIA